MSALKCTPRPTSAVMYAIKEMKVRSAFAFACLVILWTATPCFSNPLGYHWVNTSTYYGPPALTLDFESDPLGGPPTGWSIAGGAAVVTDQLNHTLGGSQSVALTASPGGTASMTFFFPIGIQGFSIAVSTLPFGTSANLVITSPANTYSEVGVYSFASGEHLADAGLGMSLEEILPPQFFNTWVVFDRSGPLFDPQLNVVVGPSVDHKPDITDWDHAPVFPVPPPGPTNYFSFTASLQNLGVSDLTVYVDDLRGFDAPILAVPEPPTMPLLLVAAVGLLFVSRRTNRENQSGEPIGVRLDIKQCLCRA